jgi:hypothetical protein
VVIWGAAVFGLNLLIKPHPELAKDLARIGSTPTSVHIRCAGSFGTEVPREDPGFEIVKTVA